MLGAIALPFRLLPWWRECKICKTSHGKGLTSAINYVYCPACNFPNG